MFQHLIINRLFFLISDLSKRSNDRTRFSIGIRSRTGLNPLKTIRKDLQAFTFSTQIWDIIQFDSVTIIAIYQ